jgi:hypothetical protein
VDKKVAATELKQMEFPIDVYERNQAWETEILFMNYSRIKRGEYGKENTLLMMIRILLQLYLRL